jgi:hypothetical protein
MFLPFHTTGYEITPTGGETGVGRQESLKDVFVKRDSLPVRAENQLSKADIRGIGALSQPIRHKPKRD